MCRLLILVASLLLQGPVASSADVGQLNIVVGFATGGTSSTAARIIAESVEAITGSSVMVENRPGAGGLIAAEWVRQQTGSPTLLFMSSTSVAKIPPSLGLVPVGVVASYSFVAAARKDGPANLDEYMKAAKQDAALRFAATAGAGSIAHLIGVKLFKDYGVSMTHVPFQGSAPAIRDVLGGHIPLAVVPYPDFIAFKDQLRVIAETGRGIRTDGWVAIFAPPNTSAQEVGRLAGIFQKASVRSKEKLERVGFRQSWRAGDELRSMYESEYAEWLPMLDTLGIKP